MSVLFSRAFPLRQPFEGDKTLLEQCVPATALMQPFSGRHLLQLLLLHQPVRHELIGVLLVSALHGRDTQPWDGLHRHVERTSIRYATDRYATAIHMCIERYLVMQRAGIISMTAMRAAKATSQTGR